MAARTAKIWTTAIVAVVLFTFSVLGVLLFDESTFLQKSDRTYAVHVEGDYRTQDDAEPKPLPADYRFDLQGSQRVVVNGHFARDVPENELLILRVDNLSVEMKVNGQAVLAYGEPGTFSSYALSPGNGWVSVVSPGITSYDEVEFVLESHYAARTDKAFASFFANLQGGYESDIILANLHESFPNMVLSVFLCCLGVIAAVIGVALRRMAQGARAALSFAALSLSTGVWFFIDFSIQGYLLPFPVFNNALDIASLLFVSLFVAVYFAINLTNSLRLMLLGLAAASLMLLVVMGVCQLAGWRDYYDFPVMAFAVFALTGLGIVVAMIREWIKAPSATVLLLTVSSLCVCLGGLIDLVLVMANLAPSIFWVKVGFMLFLVLQFISIARTFRTMAAESSRAKILRVEQEEMARVLEYQQLITQATRGLYDCINEFDLTHNCAGADGTKAYFESIGISREASFDEFLLFMSETQVKEEYAQGYLAAFNREKLLRGYTHGEDQVAYEVLVTADAGASYYWLRIVGRLFAWKDDRSIRLISYRQNIDAEKRRELVLEDKTKRDAMTGLYNKVSTECLIDEVLMSPVAGQDQYALMIFDVDDFKSINDTLGHAEGDNAIRKFAKTLQSSFRETDIVGRIGGDEFVVFLRVPDRAWLLDKAQQLLRVLKRTMEANGKSCEVSASIGIAFSPASGRDFATLYRCADIALYRMKQAEKGGYEVFGD